MKCTHCGNEYSYPTRYCIPCDQQGIIEGNGVWSRGIYHDGEQNIFTVEENGHPRFQSTSAFDAHTFYTQHKGGNNGAN